MEAEYKLTEDDHVEAIKQYMKITPKRLMYQAIMLCIVGYEIVFMTDPSLEQPITLVSPFLLIVIAFGVLNIKQVCVFFKRREYRKNLAQLDPVRIRFTSEGVDFSSPDGNAYLKWDKVLKWCQNDSHVFIYRMPQFAYIVPKRIEKDGFDIKKLIDKLQSEVGAET